MFKLNYYFFLEKNEKLRRDKRSNSLQDIAFLRKWLDLNMTTRLTFDVLVPLSSKTNMTEIQVYDFLRNEKTKIRKNLLKTNIKT